MAKSSYVHLNGHLLAAVDIETTGRDPSYHEIIQIGIQLLDSHCNPMKDVSPFYHTIKPEHLDRVDPKATRVHKLDLEELKLHSPDKWQVADYLDDWWSNLDLPYRKTLAPIAHNWQFEAGFLKKWLGIESFDQFFHWAARDTMLIAIYVNDLAYLHGKVIPFTNVGLTSLCSTIGITNENPHDALADARAEAKVYKHLVEMCG